MDEKKFAVAKIVLTFSAWADGQELLYDKKRSNVLISLALGGRAARLVPYGAGL
jgi:hypothetical protein